MADHSAVVAPATNSGLVLSDGLYNTFRQIIEKVLPAFGTLYFLLAGSWNLPEADAVVASCAALAVFLGVVLSLARQGYTPASVLTTGPYDGEVVHDVTDDGATAIRVQLNQNGIDNLLNKPQLVIKGLDTGDEGSRV